MICAYVWSSFKHITQLIDTSDCFTKNCGEYPKEEESLV